MSNVISLLAYLPPRKPVVLRLITAKEDIARSVARDIELRTPHAGRKVW